MLNRRLRVLAAAERADVGVVEGADGVGVKKPVGGVPDGAWS